MNRKIIGGSAAALAALLVLGACGGGDSSDGEGGKSEVVIGIAGARVGPIAGIGTGIGDGITDWFKMVNANGGIDGRKVKLVETETQYQVPLAIEAFSRFKQQKAALVVAEGSAISDALAPSSEKAEIPLFYPGQGNLDTVDGTKLPYAFPAGPLYAHQASAVVDYFSRTAGENLKIACLAWEAAPGKEYCDGAESAAKVNGTPYLGTVEFGAKAVDLTAPLGQLLKLGATVNLHSGIFGQANLAYKGLCTDSPDTAVGTWHWGVNQASIKDVGAECMEGAVGTSMSTLVTDNPEGFQMLTKYWESKGIKPRATMDTSYSNGLYFGVIIEEAIRQADKAKGDGEITGKDLKAGLESIKDYTGYGIACPVTITSKDHSGNRALNIYKVEKGKFVEQERCVTGPPVPSEPKVLG